MQLYLLIIFQKHKLSIYTYRDSWLFSQLVLVFNKHRNDNNNKQMMKLQKQFLKLLLVLCSAIGYAQSFSSPTTIPANGNVTVKNYKL